MDIYELIEHYKKSGSSVDASVAAIFNDLNDRKGIKQALQAVDDDIMAEIFEMAADEIRSRV